MVHPSKELSCAFMHLKGSSPSPPVFRLTSQLTRLPGWVLVPGQTEPPAELQLGTLLRRVRPRPEPLTGHPCSHWQHGQLHQRWCGPGSSLQGARRKYVHQPTGNYPGHGTATEQGRGEGLSQGLFWVSVCLCALNEAQVTFEIEIEIYFDNRHQWLCTLS